MLRSRKLNELGPNPLPGAKCACGCEVYMSRPQVGMKDVACIAAKGDEASIIMQRRWADTAPKLPLRDQLIDIERKSAAGNDFRICQLLICEVRQVNSEDDDDNWGSPKVVAIQLRARTIEACFAERSRLVGELLECSRHRGSFSSSFLWELGVQGRKWWLG
jgi:hypothetical protein